MSHPYSINHSETPIRLFKSDLLEFFTHITPATVVAIWLPAASVFLWQAFVLGAGLHILFGFLLGLFLWTLIEYLLHRFIFHFEPHGAFQERVIYLFHGVHHEQPQCKTRLVMPPVVSIPLAVIFYALFYGVFVGLLHTPRLLSPLMAGLIIGYLIYDLTHYAAHHFPMKWGFLKFIKRYHMQHHYKTPEQRFGVSSPLWDFVFGTMPKEE